jgi:DNA-binding CsgD family transcriptional regulator
LATEALHRAGTDEERASVAAAQALTVGCALGRVSEAAAALLEAARTVHSSEGRAVLAAAEAVLALYDEDPQQALRLAEGMRSGTGACDRTCALATAVTAVGLALSGQTVRALESVTTGYAALAAAPSAVEPVLARFALLHAEVVALHLAGRIRELERRTAEVHGSILEAPESAGEAIAVLHRGWAALACGRPREALRWLLEARSGLQRHDPMGMSRLTDALLAIARALVGDVEEAGDALARIAGAGTGTLPTLQPITGLARGCLTAAAGRSTEAAALVIEAATRAVDGGQEGLAAILLHRAVGYGRAADVAMPLRGLAARLDAPLVADLADHAQASAHGDGRRLDELSSRLQEAGALMLAADAAMEAAAAHERSGARRAAAESRTRAMVLARECGVHDAPVFDLMTLPTLTEREAEVARLASQGMTNQDIADRLVVSVRTVEAHLSHVYTKFGITRRADLGTALAAAASHPRQARRNGHRDALDLTDSPGGGEGWQRAPAS